MAKEVMGPYLWCAMGAAIGWLASRMMPVKGFVPMIEAMATGVFGAFLGGEFLPQMIFPPTPAATGLNGVAVGMGLAGTVLCLVLLGWMRKSVGPLKSGKKRRAS